jgi:chromosome segregation ATPase
MMTNVMRAQGMTFEDSTRDEAHYGAHHTTQQSACSTQHDQIDGASGVGATVPAAAAQSGGSSKLAQAHELIGKSHETIAVLERELISVRAAEASMRAKVRVLEEGAGDAGVGVEAMEQELEHRQQLVSELQRDSQRAERREREMSAELETARREAQELRLENDTLRGEGRMQKQLLVELQTSTAILEEETHDGGKRLEHATMNWQVWCAQ